MKLTATILTIVIFMIGCQKRHSSNKDCISYFDSLTINLDNHELKVSLINLVQEHKIKPYSLIYDEHLIVLNKVDSFYSFSINCFHRDLKHESQLNTKQFKKAFIISDTLYGIDSVNQAFRFDKTIGDWIKKQKQLPFSNSEPIYETDKYIFYSICQGEFGGLVFFYNKFSHKITFAPATCAVSLMKFKEGFYIVSNMAHMDGNSDIILVNNPDLLYELPDSLYENYKWDDIFKFYPILADTSIYNKQIVHVYSEWIKLLTSGFRIKGKNYFLTNMSFKDNYSTYLTRFKNDTLTVIPTSDTIFSALPASHGELTKIMDDRTVIDYTLFADDPRDWKEYDYRNLLLTTFIINDSSLIRINWRHE